MSCRPGTSTGGYRQGAARPISLPAHLTGVHPGCWGDFRACDRSGPHPIRIDGSVPQGVWLVRYLYCKAHAIWSSRDRGASAVEYGLLVAGIAAVIVAIVFLFGAKINTVFSDTCKAVNKGTAC